METSRFKLREIQESDIYNIHKGLSNPELTRYYDVHFPSLEATREQMDWYADLRRNGTGIWWAILTKDTNDFCGAAGFNSLDTAHKKAEIGLWLLPEFWGQNILAEVMPAVFKFGFEELSLNRIEGFVQSENKKCRQALKKVNLTYEGTMRQVEVKGNEFIDVDIFSILKSEVSL